MRAPSQKYPLLTPEEETELGKIVQEGIGPERDAAIEKLTVSNLRLVICIAKDFLNCGLELEDLVSAGNEGLAESAARFDPGRGCSFATYASYWIKCRIRRALAHHGHQIRRPVFQCERIAQLNRAAVRLRESLGRDPTEDEVTEASGLSASQAAEARQLSMRPVSLDAPVDNDGQSKSWAELVADDDAVSPCDQLSGLDITQAAIAALDILSERERVMVTDRFGLSGEPPMTFKECGRRWGITVERSRQVMMQILAKLRRKIQQRENPDRRCMVQKVNGHNVNGKHLESDTDTA
jgi:RNA polymerase primary sigma factor